MGQRDVVGSMRDKALSHAETSQRKIRLPLLNAEHTPIKGRPKFRTAGRNES
jgi:hypothetical protein